MGSIFNELYNIAKDTEGYGEKILMSIGIIVLAILIYYLIKKLTKKIFTKPKHRIRVRAVSMWILFIGAVSAILYTWFNAIEGFLIGFTVLIALVVFSMRDLAINFAGYIYLKIRKPFKIGDSVEIAGHLGDISHIELFEFSMREVGGWLRSKQYTGVNIHLPNKMIFNNPFKNYTEDYPYVWFDIAFIFDLKSNIKKVEDLMYEIGERQLKEVIKRDQEDEKMRKYLDRLSNDMELTGAKIFSTVTSNYKLEGLEVALKVFCKLQEKSMVTTKIEREIINMVNENDDVIFARYPVDLKN